MTLGLVDRKMRDRTPPEQREPSPRQITMPLCIHAWFLQKKYQAEKTAQGRPTACRPVRQAVEDAEQAGLVKLR
jgi:hypothetical protein